MLVFHTKLIFDLLAFFLFSFSFTGVLIEDLRIMLLHTLKTGYLSDSFNIQHLLLTLV